MSQTLVGLYVHFIFSTKHRAPLIVPEIEADLYAYIGGIARNNKSKLIAANGFEDHVHLLVSVYKNLGLSDFIGEVKRDSSNWIKTQSTDYRNFYWQDGYGAFSVGQSQLQSVQDYIARQKIKHAKVSFQYEFRDILSKYEIPYDERYVWD